MSRQIRIPFISPMVRAIAAGAKTETRRLGDKPEIKPGDILLVCEAAWYWCEVVIEGKTKKTGRPKCSYKPTAERVVVYCADGGKKPLAPHDDHPGHVWRWKPPRYMPNWAVRHKLVVDGVRRERIQDITVASIKSEGVTADVAADLIRDLRAKGHPGEAAHWLSQSRYTDESITWCFACATEERARVIEKHPELADAILVEGGWGGHHHDVRPCCGDDEGRGCGKQLDGWLTDHGAEEEIDHYIAREGAIDPYDAYCLDQLFCDYRDNEDVLRLAWWVGWTQIHGPAAWDDNREVRVISFHREQP